MNIVIRNGRLVDPKAALDAPLNLYLAEGRVAGIGRVPEGFVAEREIDAAGLVVAPGLIDLSARPVRLESELTAAVAGGVTTLVCPPDLDPILDEPELIERLRRESADLALARLLPLGALTQGLAGERLSEMAGLKRAGAIAFSQGKRPILDTQALLRAFEYAATFGFSVWLQPQDYYLSRSGFAHDGEVSARLGLAGIPVSAETVAIATTLTLAADTRVRLHLRRLSSAAGIAMVKKAQDEGVAVTCDVGIHHLLLSEADIGFFDAQARFDPPLRSLADQEKLGEGVALGVAALCSDHTPLDQDHKLKAFGEASPGATGLELLLPLTLEWARRAGRSHLEALAPLTAHPAAILGRDDLGHLGVGAAADVILFDPEARWEVKASTLKSFGKNSPFLNQTLAGQIQMTLIGGRIVHAENECQELQG
ncbi:MAG: dihydroorotase [Zoogloeaceae bacterium]|jgi:dihydroorotase|nr:dihydroorotase [Zoogloeaceae bacterium]